MAEVLRHEDGAVIFHLNPFAVQMQNAMLPVNGEEVAVKVVRFLDPTTGLGFEVVFDRDNWQKFKAQDLGIEIASTVPEEETRRFGRLERP
jgi:hypothetical protein